MKPETIYAFRCNKKEEKALMHRVNSYLGALERTTSKAKNPDMLKRYAPHVIKHFYWNLNKETGTWFDLYPNEDVNGNYFYPDLKNYAWLMRVRIDLTTWRVATQDKAETFIAGLIAATGFEFIVVSECDSLS
jgi:hypothetical protein